MAALAAASLTGLPSFPAIGQEGRREQDNPARRLPSRGEFVVQDAYVMTWCQGWQVLRYTGDKFLCDDIKLALPSQRLG
jgi:hypothetical protein